MSDALILHSLEASATQPKSHAWRIILGVVIVVGAVIGWLAYEHNNPVSTNVTAYRHTGVLDATGIAAQGKYVWIADNGALPQGDTGVNHGEKVVRLDVATGATTSITSPLFLLPFAVVTSPHYVWVLNQSFADHRTSILRINEATLAVTIVKLPILLKYAFNYSGGGYVVAGGYLWISTTAGIVRVNTSTLAISMIKSPLLTGGPSGAGMVADSHYVWLSESVQHPGEANPLSRKQYLVRVAINTEAVTKVTFRGYLPGWPIADDGTHLWVEDQVGVQRFNFKTGRETLILMPDNVGLSDSPSGIDTVANGNVYLAASMNGNMYQGAIVSVNIATGRVSIVSSPFMRSLNGVTAAKGIVWAFNSSPGEKVRQPVLVRVS
jgi:hypothetical protein